MTQPITSPESNKILRAAIWVAIGALIAAAIVCVVWVLIDDAGGIVPKAFLTVLLLAGFAGVSIFVTNAAPRRPAWYTLASMLTWVLILLIGAFMIWMPENASVFGSADRFFRFVLIVLVLQGALLHLWLFVPAHLRYETGFTTVVTFVTVGLVVILAIMLVLPLALFEQLEFKSLYWRVVVALAILAAVGTALVPLVNALFAPKKQRGRKAHAYGAAAPAWPTYADAVTPLPVLPDGTPDWNAYYTGQPTVTTPPSAPQATPPAGQDTAAPTPPSGYEGFPPPPPLPPRS